jgi:hypothetical protein
VHLEKPNDAWVLLVSAGCLEVSGTSSAGDASRITGLGEGSLLTSADQQAAGLAQISLRAGGTEPLELLVMSGPELSQALADMPALRQFLEERALSSFLQWIGAASA